MKGQIMFEEVAKMPKQTDKIKYQKQKWRNKLQEYCDKEAYSDENQCSAWCKCGYMSYCDYCNGAGKTNACVKAIFDLLKEKKVCNIDYNNYDFKTFLEKVEGE